MRKLFLAACLVGASFWPLAANGLMTSTNYTIYADSIETGGGLSTGGIYSLEDTFGETPAGVSTSSAYEIRAGYQYMVSGYLTMALSANSVNLGNLSQTAVNAAASTVTISTDSWTGYTLSISAVSGTAVASVSDGVVTAGSEEYGVAAAGGQSAVSGDVAIAAGTTVASSALPIDSSQTVLTFKASIGPSSSAGARSQTVTLTASANL